MTAETSNVIHLSWAAMIVDASNDVRARGYAQADAAVAEVRREAVGRALRSSTYAVVADAVTYLETRPDEDSRALLVAAHRDPSRPAHVRLFRAGIAAVDAFRHRDDDAVPVPPMVSWPDAPAPEGFADVLYDAVCQTIARLRATIERARAQTGDAPGPGGGRSWADHQHDKVVALAVITPATCRQAARGIAGDGPVPAPVGRAIDTHLDLARAVAPGLTPLQLLRLGSEPDHWAGVTLTSVWGLVDLTSVELRVLVDALTRLGAHRPYQLVADRAFDEGWARLSPPHRWDPALMWPLFVERPDRLDDALGLGAPELAATSHEIVVALAVLEAMPVLPGRYLPLVSRLALAGPKKQAVVARRVVERHGDPVAVAVGGLTYARAAVRADAARWLADVAGPGALPHLRTALESERAAAARDALVEAIARVS